MLFLNESEIRKAISMKEVIDAIDKSYEVYESNEFKMPTRLQVKEDDNTLLLMPCFAKQSIATKLVTVFPDNKIQPTLNGVVVLNDRYTGEINALIEGSFLTGIRTGAIGGSAARHLAESDVKSLAVIGTGVQGLYHTVAVCAERDIEDIYVYNRTAAKIPDFIKKLEDWIGTRLNIHIVTSAEKAITNAEVIITTTTSSNPVLPDNEEILKGKLFIGVGSFQPTMREFPESLYRNTKHIFVDTEGAIKESGDIAIPLENGWIKKDMIKNMSTHIKNKSKTPSHRENSIIFKTTGMALFDTVCAELIYQNAIEKNLGVKLTR